MDEDAADQVFDETNLLQPNRSTGDDRIEGGQRLNYGLKLGLHDAGGGASWLFLGQSFRLQRDPSFPSGSGLRSELSDPIAALSINPGRYWDIFGHVRVDKDKPSRVRAADVLASVGPREFCGFAGYILVKDNLDTSTSLGNRSEGRLGFPSSLWGRGHKQDSHATTQTQTDGIDHLRASAASGCS